MLLGTAQASSSTGRGISTKSEHAANHRIVGAQPLYECCTADLSAQLDITWREKASRLMGDCSEMGCVSGVGQMAPCGRLAGEPGR